MKNEDQRLIPWWQQILAEHSKQNASAVALGQIMVKARDDLKPAGLWLRFLKSDKVPFGTRKAQMLMRIHEAFGNVDAQTFAHLPGGWSILHELAQLDRQRLEKEIHAGGVHPRLTLKQAKELTGNNKPPRQKPPGEWADKIYEKIRLESVSWGADDRQSVYEVFTQVLTALVPNRAADTGRRPLPAGRRPPAAAPLRDEAPRAAAVRP